MKSLFVVALLALAGEAWAQGLGGPPPPATPPQLLQDVGKALGYVPKCVGWFHITSRLSIGLSKDVGDFYTVGGRDINNGQWLAGWGKEIAPIRYDDREVAFLSAHNVFSADEGGKGAIGAALGTRPVNLINSAAKAVGAAKDIIPIPPALQGLNNYTSIEISYDRRFQSVQGVSQNVIFIGGQVRVPFNLLQHN